MNPGHILHILAFSLLAHGSVCGALNASDGSGNSQKTPGVKIDKSIEYASSKEIQQQTSKDQLQNGFKWSLVDKIPNLITDG